MLTCIVFMHEGKKNMYRHDCLPYFLLQKDNYANKNAIMYTLVLWFFFTAATHSDFELKARILTYEKKCAALKIELLSAQKELEAKIKVDEAKSALVNMQASWFIAL